MPDIILAKSAGFCFGVARAIDLAYETADKGACVCLGSLIHNEHVVADLAARGVRLVEHASEINPNETVIIRSHGIEKNAYEQLQAQGTPIADATCPYVKKIHNTVASSTGLTIIAGNADHPEVKAICSYCPSEYIVISDETELPQTDKPCIIVAQTTFSLKKWEKIKNKAKKCLPYSLIYDTICKATDLRQKEAEEIAKKSCFMFVVGSNSSSNTKELYNVCSNYCETKLITNANNISEGALGGDSFCAIPKDGLIGITAGASTPKKIIDEVVKFMSEVTENQVENLENKELTFEELLNGVDDKAVKLYPGKRVAGVVSGVGEKDIAVDIGAKQTGFVPFDELFEEGEEKIVPQVGDDITVVVLSVSDADGSAVLSKKQADAFIGFETLEKAMETGEIMNGKVVGSNKGGLLCVSEGMRVFVPSSQISLLRVDDLTKLVGEEIEFKVTDIRDGNRVIGSIKAVLLDRRKVLAEEFWKTVEVGKEYSGPIKSIVDYGVFVDLGGVDGMVHITELSWSKIKHPSQVVKFGDVITVYVKEIDNEKRRISLSYRKTEENPWVDFEENYHEGDVVPAKIMSLTPFGAFAQVANNIDGLIHVSQISHDHIDRVSDVLEPGQVVDVKIIEIDIEHRRVGLSMRALLPEPEKAEEEAAAAEAAEVAADAAAAGIELVTSDETAEETVAVTEEVAAEETTEDTATDVADAE
jgi:(E)-4-hydroxy-3-methyl-but-2-enyl pyrophosphate reductase (IPP and DMAPP forming)